MFIMLKLASVGDWMHSKALSESPKLTSKLGIATQDRGNHSGSRHDAHVAETAAGWPA